MADAGGNRFVGCASGAFAAVEPATDLAVFDEVAAVGLLDSFAACDAEMLPAQFLQGYA